MSIRWISRYRICLFLVIANSEFALAQVIAPIPEPLTLAEKESLVSKIRSCWKGPPGNFNSVTIFSFSLDKAGKVSGQPTPSNSVVMNPTHPAYPAFQAAFAALVSCQPYPLPVSKYDQWKRVERLIFIADPKLGKQFDGHWSSVVQSTSPEESYHYVANTRPPDAYLSLRSQPTSRTGSRIVAMPNGTQLKVLQRRDDGWWYVRVVASGREGWALSGQENRQWIESTPPQVQSVQSPAPEGKEQTGVAKTTPKAASTSGSDSLPKGKSWEVFCPHQRLPENQNIRVLGITIYIHDSDRELFLDKTKINRFLDQYIEPTRRACAVKYADWQKNYHQPGNDYSIPNAYNAEVDVDRMKYFSQTTFSAYKLQGATEWTIRKNDTAQSLLNDRAAARAAEEARQRLEEQRRLAALQQQKAAEARAQARREFVLKYRTDALINERTLTTNPFVYAGKAVGVHTSFRRMLSSDSGLFHWDDVGQTAIFVSGLPSTQFANVQPMVLAVKVIGTKIIKVGAGEVTLPHGEYLGFFGCRDSRCSEFYN